MVSLMIIIYLKEYPHVSSETLDHDTSLICQLGPNSLITRADLSYFLTTPIHPDHNELIAFQFDVMFYDENISPRGASKIQCIPNIQMIHSMDVDAFIQDPHS